jgi:predicted enzyme related to lactoylglutathione lyase
MTQPVSYVELNSPDLASSARFFADAFGWDPQPFAAPDYLSAAAATSRTPQGSSSASTRTTQKPDAQLVVRERPRVR